MPKTDPDGLHPTLSARLRAELDQVRPPHGEPRYMTSRAPLRAWRLAPIVLAVAFTGIVALTAFAATGSPNPAVWTNKVENVINPSQPSPSPEETPTPTQPPVAPVAAPTHAPTHAPTSSPEHESPEPDDHQSQRPSASPSPSPSGDH